METQMKRTMIGSCVGLLWLASAGSLIAHHSLANYDTTTAVRVRGTVVLVHEMNPHSFIFLDQIGSDGQRQRWAIEGPSLVNLSRRSVPKDFLKVGDSIEVCGYLPKEKIVWQIASPDQAANSVSVSGRLINAELLVMPDGMERSWGDYGFHRCFAPGYKDQHDVLR
jgi:hypothetical protein